MRKTYSRTFIHLFLAFAKDLKFKRRKLHLHTCKIFFNKRIANKTFAFFVIACFSISTYRLIFADFSNNKQIVSLKYIAKVVWIYGHFFSISPNRIHSNVWKKSYHCFHIMLYFERVQSTASHTLENLKHMLSLLVQRGFKAFIRAWRRGRYLLLEKKTCIVILSCFKI